MTTVTVQRLDESTPSALHHHYQGEIDPQPCFVQLDTESGELTADWDDEVGPGTPESVQNNQVLRWTIPLLTAAAANGLLEEIAPAAQQVLDGWAIDWDGSNHRGHVTEDSAGQAASAALAEIATECGRDFADSNLVVELDASYWFINGDSDLDDLGVTASSTDTELATLAAQAAAEAGPASVYGYQVLDGALEVLTSRRDELGADAEI
ncbi:hypothetical protein AB0C34_17165 [Nocardia sp. NPDC049220]|uniref:hypothetical protein n=1 Tax=Nocardia sp. NPDC049220 TaxID=3155273 RepID=UPI0033D84B24